MFIDTEDRAFNLTLELLKGCGYSCADCAIDKSATSDLIVGGDEQALVRLVKEMRGSGYRLHELTVGPTDIVSATNGTSILRSNLFLELLEQYDSLTLSAALLFDRGLAELGQYLNSILGKKKFRLIVPCTLKNAGNEKFMGMIRDRIALIRDNMPDTTFKMVYLTINVVNSSARNFHLDTNKIAQDADLGIPKLVEYAFPHSRRGFNNLLTREEFLRDFRAFTDGMKSCKDTHYNRYLIPTVSDSVEAIYHDGELYRIPVLMEKFPIFANQFMYQRPWHAEQIIEREEEGYYSRLIKYAETQPCADCCFLDNCSRGSTQQVMEFLSIDGCMLDMKNRWDLTPSTNPVHSDE